MWPDACLARESSFSAMITVVLGLDSRRAMPVVRPIDPPPMMRVSHAVLACECAAVMWGV